MPGIGFGGSCFPKDVKALIKTADDFGYSLDVIKAVEECKQQAKRSDIPENLHSF